MKCKDCITYPICNTLILNIISELDDNPHVINIYTIKYQAYIALSKRCNLIKQYKMTELIDACDFIDKNFLKDIKK